MKQGHLFIVYAIIFCGCFLSLYCVRKNYDSVMQDKQWLEYFLLTVAEDTGNRSKAAVGQEEERKLQIIETAFSEAVRVFSGNMDMQESMEFWQIYVPMLVWVEEDGAFFHYLQQDTEQAESEWNYIWSEKIAFSFPDGCSDKKKKSVMADYLEQAASEIITNHNSIAKQYGISYQYSLPVFFQDTSRLSEFPMLFVVFQGWPLGNSNNCFFNACVDAGIFLRQKEEIPPGQYPSIYLY